jgi:sugar/nucleoside kinase (ribokinase family)
MSHSTIDFDFDLVAVGSLAIDHIHRVTVLPKRDAGVAILDRRTGPGGVEGNIAAAAASLGLRVGMIGHVGADEAGEMILADFRERGVDISRLQVGAPGDTAYTYAFVDAQGDRIMMTGGLGVRGLTLDDDDDAYIRRARVVSTSGYLPWPLLQRVAAICAEPDGPLLSFDLPGEFDDLEGRGFKPEHMEALLPRIDLFITSRESLLSYTGAATIEDGLAYLRARSIRRAAVSDGSQGVHLFEVRGDLEVIHHLPAFPVQVVDTTGAGDVLHAALVAEWLLGERPANLAGRAAAAAAALACQGWGTRSALPSREEAEGLAGAGNPPGT